MWEEGSFHLPDLTGAAIAVRLPHNYCNHFVDFCLPHAGFNLRILVMAMGVAKIRDLTGSKFTSFFLHQSLLWYF